MDGHRNPTRTLSIEDLRSLIGVRARKRRRRFIAVACAAALPLLASALGQMPKLLLWNASRSAPVGLYRIEQGAPVRVGEWAVAWAPPATRRLAERRRYLPASVPLVKRVSASAGDRVCELGNRLVINSRTVATALKSDPRGRPMPRWSGCRTLRPGEYLLLGEGRYSFDGRYFGVTRQSAVIGKAVPIWRP